MRTTKTALVSALLVSAVAIGLAPSVAADDPVSCVTENEPLFGSGEVEEIPQCTKDHIDGCEDMIGPLTLVNYGRCLAGLE